MAAVCESGLGGALCSFACSDVRPSRLQTAPCARSSGDGGTAGKQLMLSCRQRFASFVSATVHLRATCARVDHRTHVRCSRCPHADVVEWSTRSTRTPILGFCLFIVKRGADARMICMRRASTSDTFQTCMSSPEQQLRHSSAASPQQPARLQCVPDVRASRHEQPSTAAQPKHQAPTNQGKEQPL